MGLILDTSAIIAVERQGLSPSQSFAQIAVKAGNVPIAISVITVLELMHGVERARTELQSRRQSAFVEILCRGLTAFPISMEIARLAGRIEGSLAARGIAIALDDLLIGATALQHNFSVATLNVKHFAQIPNLSIISL
jgi:tRNA(fMet)-specific endonuclease VapC